MKDQKKTGKIGPHEGRELELMLAGEKPLAMFADVVPSAYQFPDAVFEPYVKSGHVVKKDFMVKVEGIKSDELFDFRYLFYALPQEVWRIDKAFAASSKDRWGWDQEAIDDSFIIGRLLGYEDIDIQAFVDRITKSRAER